MTFAPAEGLIKQFVNYQVKLTRENFSFLPDQQARENSLQAAETSFFDIFTEHLQGYPVLHWDLLLRDTPTGCQLHSEGYCKPYRDCIDLSERNGALKTAIDQIEAAIPNLKPGSIAFFTSPQGSSGKPNTNPYTNNQTYVFLKGDNGKVRCFTIVTRMSLDAIEKFSQIPTIRHDNSISRIEHIQSKVGFIHPNPNDNEFAPILELIKRMRQASDATSDNFDRIQHLLFHPEEAEQAWQRFHQIQKEFHDLISTLHENGAFLTAMALNYETVLRRIIAISFGVPTTASGTVHIEPGCVATRIAHSESFLSKDKDIVCPDCGWKPSISQKILIIHGLLTKCPVCGYNPCLKSGRLSRSKTVNLTRNHSLPVYIHQIEFT